VEDAAGDVLWGLADHEGTIRDLVDATGTMQEHRKYDMFGRMTSPAVPTADFPRLYGRALDEDTGLYNYRAVVRREVGRFMADLSGFGGGDEPVPLRGNSPVIYVDPSGLVYPGLR
jgi:uncharacterized protein RhaS with RHS repeats